MGVLSWVADKIVGMPDSQDQLTDIAKGNIALRDHFRNNDTAPADKNATPADKNAPPTDKTIKEQVSHSSLGDRSGLTDSKSDWDEIRLGTDRPKVRDPNGHGGR